MRSNLNFYHLWPLTFHLFFHLLPPNSLSSNTPRQIMTESFSHRFSFALNPCVCFVLQAPECIHAHICTNVPPGTVAWWHCAGGSPFWNLTPGAEAYRLPVESARGRVAVCTGGVNQPVRPVCLVAVAAFCCVSRLAFQLLYSNHLVLKKHTQMILFLCMYCKLHAQ